LQKWFSLTDEEKRAGLAADGTDALLQYLPEEMRGELADRVQRVRHKTSKDRVLTALFREYVEQQPAEPIGKYVHTRAINHRRLVVHVDRDDAPGLRRPPLMTAANSASVH
jgi:hypothetical protein